MLARTRKVRWKPNLSVTSFAPAGSSLRFPVLFQLPVLPCVLRRLIVHRRSAELFFLGNQIIRFVFNEVLECFHVPGINLTEGFVEIGKGRAMAQQGVGLFIRQLVVLKEKQHIFPNAIFISVV